MVKSHNHENSSGYARKVIRVILGILQAFAALNAFGGGYYAMAGAEGVPVEWLEGSPFSTYFIPGLLLFTVVGGMFLFASIAVLFRFRLAVLISYASAVTVIIWLTVQMIIIGYVSWMQPVTAATAIIIVVLTYFLYRKK